VTSSQHTRLVTQKRAPYQKYSILIKTTVRVQDCGNILEATANYIPTQWVLSEQAVDGCIRQRMNFRKLPRNDAFGASNKESMFLTNAVLLAGGYNPYILGGSVGFLLKSVSVLSNAGWSAELPPNLGGRD
jgi:hypothetical protein